MHRSITVGLVLVLAVATAVTLLPRKHRAARPVGFEVLLLKQGPRATLTDHWENALVVHVDHDHSWGLNNQKLSPTDLKEELQHRLCRRAEKVVLFEGDSEISFSEAAKAMDTIQSACPSAVALITPNAKKVGFDRLYLPAPKHDSNKALPQSLIPEELR